jgi:long-chain acyl-CoA synthetase
MGLIDHASRHPDAWALDDGTRRRSWSELLDRSHRLAHVLRDDLGLTPGEHVASIMGNRVEFFELSLAALWAGVWLVPVNTHVSDEELAYLLADSGARAVLVDDAHRGAVDRVPAAAAGPAVVGIGPDLDARAAAASDEPLPLDGPAGGRMHYTSGTTGRPKGVKRALPPTAGEYVALLGRLALTLGLDGSGPHLLTGPHYHAAVGGYALFDLANGAPVAMLPRFDAAATLDAITTRGIAHTHLVPTMMVRLLRLDPEVRAAFDPAPLRVVLHGAAPIAPAVKRSMIEWWGPVLREYWGTSEAGTFTVIDSDDWLAHPGSVGRAVPGVEVVALDEEGRRLPAGEVGTLYCRIGTDPRPFRYHGDEAKTDAAFAEPGLFTMGDMGAVDDEGYVRLSDRATNMIITGGVNVYPAEVEAALVSHPAVADVAVFGVPDEEWGEQVKAAVELTPGSVAGPGLEAELIDFAREHIAHYKAPKSIDFTEALPRMPSGKLAVRMLKAPYWQGRDRNI